MTIGVLLSAGGSAFAEVVKASRHLPIRFVAVTDRACGSEARCAELGVPQTRIVSDNAKHLSAKVAEHFKAAEVRSVVLHFSRLVTSELHEALPCYNVHGSLLPAFPGMTGLQQARNAGVRFLGATAHRVDAGMDTGQILVQAVVPVRPDADEAWWGRASFLQKTLVSLVLVECLLRDFGLDQTRIGSEPPQSPFVNPPLRDARTIAAFRALQTQHAITVFDP